MPGPWDKNRGQGQIDELPLGGLLSELLASEGVDPSDFSGFLSEPPVPPSAVCDTPEQAPVAVDSAEPPAIETPQEAPTEFALALPGLAAQLWALNEATTPDSPLWAPVEDVEPEPELTPIVETQDFALPGLLLSLTDEVTGTEAQPELAAQVEPGPEPELEPEPEPAPDFEPEPISLAATEVEEPVVVAEELPVDIVGLPAEPPVVAQVAVPHVRANDLSNLIGAIDSEIAASPELPPGRAHELDKTHERFVCFRLAGISCGLHMRLVREVERISRVTQVPGAPRLVCGLINLRGEILPLIDTRLLLDLEPAGWPPSGYLLVVQPDPDESPLALLVDELGGVAIVDPAAVGTDISELKPSLVKHTLGTAEHRGRVLLLLDHRNLVTADALMASAECGSSN